MFYLAPINFLVHYYPCIPFASAVEGVFFKNIIKNGKLIIPVIASEMGCAMIIPSSPMVALVISKTGINTAPERIIAIKDAIAAFRML